MSEVPLYGQSSEVGEGEGGGGREALSHLARVGNLRPIPYRDTMFVRERASESAREREKERAREIERARKRAMEI